MDRVRVLRIIEYVGPRRRIEQQIANSLHGTKVFGTSHDGPITIRVATIGSYPEIIEPRRDDSFDSAIGPNEAFEAKDWGTRGA